MHSAMYEAPPQTYEFEWTSHKTWEPHTDTWCKYYSLVQLNTNLHFVQFIKLWVAAVFAQTALRLIRQPHTSGYILCCVNTSTLIMTENTVTRWRQNIYHQNYKISTVWVWEDNRCYCSPNSKFWKLEVLSPCRVSQVDVESLLLKSLSLDCTAMFCSTEKQMPSWKLEQVQYKKDQFMRLAHHKEKINSVTLHYMQY